MSLNVIDFFCCKQKTAYEMRISDWSSDVCSSDLRTGAATEHGKEVVLATVSMLIGENPRVVAQASAERLAEAARALPQGIEARPLYDRPALVERTNATVQKKIAEGELHVLLILILLLGNFRAELITAACSPVVRSIMPPGPEIVIEQ